MPIKPNSRTGMASGSVVGLEIDVVRLRAEKLLGDVISGFYALGLR